MERGNEKLRLRRFFAAFPGTGLAMTNSLTTQLAHELSLISSLLVDRSAKARRVVSLRLRER